MLENITLDSDAKVHETLLKLAHEFPDFLFVDAFVYARNLFDFFGRAYFCIWDTNLNHMALLNASIT